jgi:hypothetical protein
MPTGTLGRQTHSNRRTRCQVNKVREFLTQAPTNVTLRRIRFVHIYPTFATYLLAWQDLDLLLLLQRASTTCGDLLAHLRPERNPWQRPESTDLAQHLPPIPSRRQRQVTPGQREKRETLSAIWERKPTSMWWSDAEVGMSVKFERTAVSSSPRMGSRERRSNFQWARQP